MTERLYIHSYQNLGDGDIERRDALSSRGTDPEEIWANSFAAALLMPAQVVAKLWAGNCSIGEMTDILDVSVTAVGHRVENLGLR